MSDHPKRPFLDETPRPWWRGFAARVMGAGALLALLIILVTASLSYNALRAKSLDVAAVALRAQASILRNDLQGRIAHMRDNLRELSTNPLFANALADDLGREVYLRDFIGGLTTVEGLDITVAMTDFRGRVIRANHPNEELVMPPQWVADMIDRSTSAGTIVIRDTAPYLFLAEPLIYRNTGTAEGALVYQVDLSQWLQSPTVDRIVAEAQWMSELSLVDGNTAQHVDGAHVRGNTWTPDDPEITQRINMPEHVGGEPLSIHLAAKASFVQTPLNELLINVSLMSAFVFLLALLASYAMSRALTRKLYRLQNEAAQVSQAKFRDIDFTNEGRDEIDDLAQAFSELIDELQNAYRQLEESSQLEIEVRERHYQSIVENSAEGIITISDRGIIETFNPSAERIFGYKAGEVLGQNISILMPRQERAAHDKYLEHSHLHAPRIINRSRDLMGLRKSGDTFPLELNVSPMDIGGAHKFIGIMRDISERKEFEQRINAARIEAEQANKAKSQFLSSMSHELRTPLNAILGFGQLLEMGEKGSLSKSQSEAIKQILKAGNLLLELIDQVLNLAKIENGNLSITIEPVDISVLLNDSLAMAKSMAKDRYIEVHADFPLREAAVYVDADATRLQQVLLNLLSNAIKYNIPEGSVTLSYRVDEAQGFCRFAVKDTGTGIPAELHDDVFAPFNRLGAENSQIEGTGIGLTITRELVLMMGGKIGFESKPGKGSTFWFDLPLTAPSARPDASSEPKLAPAPSHPQTEETAKIVLYIEDNPSNLELMEMLFTQRDDWKLTTARTAESGIAIAKASPPDLILMDINLPGMSGIEAMRALRSHASTAHIPVIAISANAMPREIEDAMKEGFLDYLTKPIDLRAAMDAIGAALNGDGDD